jgi:hypothetical protein
MKLDNLIELSVDPEAGDVILASARILSNCDSNGASPVA